MRGSDLDASIETLIYLGSSSREILLQELLKVSERLNQLPQPFCESDCPWLSFCQKYKLDWCILSDLIELNLLSDYLQREITEKKEWC